MHLHTVYMEHSDCLTLPTLLSPLVAERSVVHSGLTLGSCTKFSMVDTPYSSTRVLQLVGLKLGLSAIFGDFRLFRISGYLYGTPPYKYLYGAPAG